MPDGVKLGATIYKPVAGKSVRKRDLKAPSERFPVLLEVLPYRKDESFQLGDYPTYSYFARRGFIVVKVDIRGTGSSQGVCPDREYSDIEFTDTEEVIRQLAAMSDSNGNVAMFGVSWSGFNSIQLAMRRPPALKAILAMHASDDLFHDDVHYTDGVMHLDTYHLFINHETGLPRTPDYKLDSRYFADRFDRKPWLFRYMASQRDGEFWRSRSLCNDYGAIDIPVYIIAGLLDIYRDTAIRMVENLKTPVKADIGPWGHYCPDDGVPGPGYEWQEEAMDFFSRYMTGEASSKTGFSKASGTGSRYRRRINPATTGEDGRRMTIFVRDGHKPDVNQENTPGHWRYVDWPIKGTSWRKFYPGQGKLVEKLSASSKEKRELLVSLPGAGTAAGALWADSTGDMREDDASALVFDSAPVKEATVFAGIPEVHLKLTPEASKAFWSIRLEDVAPDGTVALVTGSLFNGCHASGILTPGELTPGETIEFLVNLHFSTWTFQPGHRIRLALSGAQFPMAWPSAEVVRTVVHTHSNASHLSLPVIPTRARRKVPFTCETVATKLDNPDGNYVDLADGKPDFVKRVERDIVAGVTRYVCESRNLYDIKRRQFTVETSNTYTTNDTTPANSSYRGEMITTIVSAFRTIKLKTLIEVNSDKENFHVSVTRDLSADGKRVRRKRWQEAIAREHH
jgi:putative hydrolase, CocE/NonD family